MSHIHIDIQGLSFAYTKNKQVLENINLHAGEHEAIGIVGANGAGKSTLLRLLVGLATDFGGSIRVEEIPVEKRTLPLIREKIGYVFQDSDNQLFMSTAYEDIAFAPRNYGLPEAEVERRVQSALEQVGIPHLRNKQLFTMSGGEKKLVSIAGILSLTPDIILMDEPSIALDPRNRRNLINLLNSFEHLKLIASHDLDLIWDTCSRTIILDKGTIVWDGPTEIALRNEKLLQEHGRELPLSLQRR